MVVNHTNLDRAAFRARHRQQPSWMEPREDSGLLRIIVWGLIAALFVGLALAFWARVVADSRNEAWAQQVFAECIAQGQRPVVVRDAAEKVLAVRCEK